MHFSPCHFLATGIGKFEFLDYWYCTSSLIHHFVAYFVSRFNSISDKWENKVKLQFICILSVLLWNVLFLLLCFWCSSTGVDQSTAFPKKFYYWNGKHSFPPCTCPLKATDKSFRSAGERCCRGFTFSRALRWLQKVPAASRSEWCWKPHLPPSCPRRAALPRLAAGWQGSQHHVPPSTCLCQEAEEGTPSSAGLELLAFLCQGNPLPARPAASSSIHTSVTF